MYNETKVEEETVQTRVTEGAEQAAPSSAAEPPSDFQQRLLAGAVLRTQLLRLAMKGVNATQAAKVVGVSSATAREVYREPEFRAEVLKKVNGAFEDIDAAFSSKKKTLHELIDEQAYRSCESLIDMLQDEQLHPSLKVKIHQDFLNRSEESMPKSGAVYKVEPAELSRAAQVAQEMDNVIQFKKKTGS